MRYGILATALHLAVRVGDMLEALRAYVARYVRKDGV